MKWKNSWRKGFWWRASITSMSFLSLGSPCLRRVSPWWFYLTWSTEISDILSVQSRGYVVPDLGVLVWATLNASHFSVSESPLGLEFLISSLQNEIVFKEELTQRWCIQPFLISFSCGVLLFNLWRPHPCARTQLTEPSGKSVQALHILPVKPHHIGTESGAGCWMQQIEILKSIL